MRVRHEDQRRVHTRLYVTARLVFRHEIAKRDTTLARCRCCCCCCERSKQLLIVPIAKCCNGEREREPGTYIPNVESCVLWRFSSHHFIAGKSFRGIYPYYVTAEWWNGGIEISLLHVIISLRRGIIRHILRDVIDMLVIKYGVSFFNHSHKMRVKSFSVYRAHFVM